MAGADLPSFYGQKARDGTVTRHPSKKLGTNSMATDMALVNNSPSTYIQPSPRNYANDLTNDVPTHPPLREVQTFSGSLPQKVAKPGNSHSRNRPSTRDDDNYSSEDREGNYGSHSVDTEEYRPYKRAGYIRGKLSREQSFQELRLPLSKWMDSEHKNHFVAFIGEFVGTTLFLFFAFAGTQVANIGSGNSTNQSTTGAATGFNPTVYLYIAICFGFSLMVNAWTFFRISGGLFNPAVTLALALLKAIGIRRAICIFIAQLSGACFAAYLVEIIFPTTLNVRTTLAGGTSITQGIFIEALCTAELVFTIIMLAMEKHKATFIAPIGIGLSLFVGELVSVYYTGGSLNPARSFGPAAVTHTFSKNDWIYWVGPLIGSIFAVAFYWFIKVLEYEMANPGQDSDVSALPRTPNREKGAAIKDSRALEEGRLNALPNLRGGRRVAGDQYGQGDGSVFGSGDRDDYDMEATESLSLQTSPTALLAKSKGRRNLRSEQQ